MSESDDEYTWMAEGDQLAKWRQSSRELIGRYFLDPDAQVQMQVGQRTCPYCQGQMFDVVTQGSIGRVRTVMFDTATKAGGLGERVPDDVRVHFCRPCQQGFTSRLDTGD